MPRSVNPDPVRQARSLVANAVKRGEDATAARRALHTAKLRRAITDALAAPEAPTPAQRAQLAALLLDGVR